MTRSRGGRIRVCDAGAISEVSRGVRSDRIAALLHLRRDRFGAPARCPARTRSQSCRIRGRVERRRNDTDLRRLRSQSRLPSRLPSSTSRQTQQLQRFAADIGAEASRSVERPGESRSSLAFRLPGHGLPCLGRRFAALRGSLRECGQMVPPRSTCCGRVREQLDRPASRSRSNPERKLQARTFRHAKSTRQSGCDCSRSVLSAVGCIASCSMPHFQHKDHRSMTCASRMQARPRNR